MIDETIVYWTIVSVTINCFAIIGSEGAYKSTTIPAPKFKNGAYNDMKLELFRFMFFTYGLTDISLSYTIFVFYSCDAGY